MGLTAPALYRYVTSYQELVDLVAFEVDKAATATFAAAADALPRGRLRRPAAGLVDGVPDVGAGQPARVHLVFANPIADTDCIRRELLTLSCSGHLCTGQMRALWEHNHHPSPPSTSCRRRCARRSSTR